MKRLNLFIIILTTVLLGACTASISSDVTRFNKLPPSKGETFIVVAKNPARDGSLEFMEYAAEVSARLRAQGYQPAGQATPDLIVIVDFGISDPLETDTTRRPSPYFGPTYFGYRYRPHYYNPYYDPYYNPYYDPYGGYYGLSGFYQSRYAYLYDTGDTRRIVYERVFEMAIQQNEGPVVFEGRAVSVGSSRDLPKVMPLMIEALFSDFPGKNGSTVRVTVKPDP